VREWSRIGVRSWTTLATGFDIPNDVQGNGYTGNGNYNRRGRGRGGRGRGTGVRVLIPSVFSGGECAEIAYLSVDSYIQILKLEHL